MVKGYAIELDIKKLTTTHSTNAIFSNSDLNTSLIGVQVVMDAQPVDLTGCEAYVNILKADNFSVKNSCEIIDEKNGGIIVNLSSQSLAAPGENTFEIVIIFSDNKRIVTPKMTYKIVKSLENENALQSSNEYGVLIEVINEVKELKEEIIDLIQNGNIGDALGGIVGGGITTEGHKHQNMDNLNYITDEKIQEWNNKSEFDGNYENLINKPALFDGDYEKLKNKPELFDGDYNKLINKPEAVTKISQLVNDSSFVTESFVTNKISEVQLSGSGSEVDLSLYATKEDLKNKAEKTHSHDEYAAAAHRHSANEIDGLASPEVIAPSIEIGTVVEGTTADATITGTASNFELNLVLPRGERGLDGIDGRNGRDFTFEDFTSEQLAMLKGERGECGPQGSPGRDGYTPIKGIDYNDGETGPAGKDGKAFAYEDFTEAQLALLKGPKGEPGIPGKGVQSDWNISDDSSDAYIRNKPAIPKFEVMSESAFSKITPDASTLYFIYK